LEFLAEYGLFLAKSVTVVVAILLIISGIVAAGMRQKKPPGGHIEIKHINDEIDAMSEALKIATIDKEVLKQQQKEKKKADKEAKKERIKAEKGGEHKKRVYVLDFDGDIKASEVSSLREEITSVLSIAKESDEVVLKLSSGGGMVHTYGLASSQLKRLVDHNIPLTVCVDKVAASGGYMMACVGNKIVAAPFAILGSIGVMAQIPNFHRLLKKNDVDFELMTAGEYKRTLTVFGENTDKGREKFREDLEKTHDLFKVFVAENRPQVNIDEVATGEIWFGTQAVEKALIDELGTSDDYIVKACNDADVFEVNYVERKSISDRFSLTAHSLIDKLLLTWWERFNNSKYY